MGASDPPSVPPKSESTQPDPVSFEEGLRRLESLVDALENDPPSLEEGVARYQEGVGLLHQLQRTLSSAEQRVIDLTEQLRQGLEEMESDDRNRDI